MRACATASRSAPRRSTASQTLRRCPPVGAADRSGCGFVVVFCSSGTARLCAANDRTIPFFLTAGISGDRPLIDATRPGVLYGGEHAPSTHRLDHRLGFGGHLLRAGAVLRQALRQEHVRVLRLRPSVPWWLAGLSMVATTFSSDTPNLVTDIVRRNGVAGNWQWWAFTLTGVATVFFYARLWRRSGVLTDLEFYEIRYSGKAAGAGARLPRGLPGPVLQLHDHGHGQPGGLQDRRRPVRLAALADAAPSSAC